MKFRKTKTYYGIDAGELDGLSRQKCFMLGVEFELFKRRIDDHRATGCGITTTVHSVNVERLAGVLQDAGIAYQRKWLNDDWVDLIVKPTDDCEAMNPRSHAMRAVVLVSCVSVLITLITVITTYLIFG